MKTAGTQSEEIEIPAQNSPIALFFVVVPPLLLVAFGYAMMRFALPKPLLGLLALAVGSSLVLFKGALEALGPTTFELTPQELIVKRWVGSASYAWSDIESVKLVDPGATFSDSGRDDEGRAGIGLFMRKTDNKPRDPEAEPDVILVARSGEEREMIVKASERIAATKRKSMGPVDTRRGPPQLGRSAKSFRRPAQSPAAA